MTAKKDIFKREVKRMRYWTEQQDGQFPPVPIIVLESVKVSGLGAGLAARVARVSSRLGGWIYKSYSSEQVAGFYFRFF